MAHQTAAGASLSTGDLPASYDASGYGAISPTLIGEITNIGEFGKQFELVTHNPLATRGTKKGKGSYNNGQLTPNLALDPNDGGQQAMETALESDQPVSFCVTLQDGTEYWMAGYVMSFRPSVGSVNDVVTASTVIEVDHNAIVKIDAS